MAHRIITTYVRQRHEFNRLLVNLVLDNSKLKKILTLWGSFL